MRHITPAILFLILSVPVLALAQGSGSSEPGKDKSAFSVTRTAVGTVVQFKKGESLAVEESGGKQQEFKLDKNSKVPADLKAGERVRITYRASDRTAVEVQRTRSSS